MKVILSGGGTGGHIFPAIAIANEIKNTFPDAQILFVGAKNRMEMIKVPQNGYEIKGLWISGLQRNSFFKNLLFPIKLLSSIIKSFFIIKKFNPDIVIGTGGFASGAILLVASFLKIKTFIQEQNSYPGITNRLLAKKVDIIFTAYEESGNFFPKEKTRFIGNPMRKELLNNSKIEEALNYYSLKPNKKNILILGGSLGAKNINIIVLENINTLLKNDDIQILWQCGDIYYENINNKIKNDKVKILPFLDNMNFAYKIAEIVISRSGALAITEILNLGKPSILIPSPNVAENHQEKNARILEKNKACILIKENELKDKFLPALINSVYNQEILNMLSFNALKMSKPNALNNIIEEIKKTMV